MKKTLLVITGTLLCVSCTTRPPLPLGETPKVSTDGRPIIPVTFVFTTNSFDISLIKSSYTHRLYQCGYNHKYLFWGSLMNIYR